MMIEIAAGEGTRTLTPNKLVLKYGAYRQELSFSYNLCHIKAVKSI